MRIIEHNHFSRQPPNNAPPTAHFPLCLRRNAGLRPGVFVHSVHLVHPPFLKGDRKRQKAAPTTTPVTAARRRRHLPQYSNTPALHFPQHSIPQIFKDQRRLPHTGSDQIAWYVLLVPTPTAQILPQYFPQSNHQTPPQKSERDCARSASRTNGKNPAHWSYSSHWSHSFAVFPYSACPVRDHVSRERIAHLGHPYRGGLGKPISLISWLISPPFPMIESSPDP
jgi:hypothetical protein